MRQAVSKTACSACALDLLRGFGQIFQRRGHAAVGMRNARQRQAHLHARERSSQHQVVEVAQMSDAKRLAGQLAESAAERHVEILQHHFAKLVGIRWSAARNTAVTELL